MQEIGFIQLSATILASGILDNQLDQGQRRAYEKKRVVELLDARYELHTITYPSRIVVGHLIDNAFQRWWVDSWFNVQIDKMRTEILSCLSVELRKKNITVHEITDHSLYINDMSACDYPIIQSAINAKYPMLIMFCAEL